MKKTKNKTKKEEGNEEGNEPFSFLSFFLIIPELFSYI